MNRTTAAIVAYALLAAGAAIAVPLFLFPADPWIEAGRAIRTEAQAGDLVVLFPESRRDRLRAFDGLWAVAADPAALGPLDAFQRTFWVGESKVPRSAGVEPRWTRNFGKVHVQLIDRRNASLSGLLGDGGATRTREASQ